MRRGWLLSAGIAIVLPANGHAQETRAGVDVAVSGGYSSNPFSETGNGTSSGYGAVDITPHVKLLTERSTFTLSGLAHLQEYTSRYPLTDTFNVSLDYRGRPSARLSTFARLDLSSSVLGSDDNYALGSVTSLPATMGGIGTGTTSAGGTGTSTGTGAATGGSTTTVPPIGVPTGPLISDIGLLGTRDRRRSLYATAGGTDALSAHDSVSLSGFLDLARYSRFGDLSNYNGYGGTLGYSRQVSAHFSAGVQGSGSHYDYQGVRGETSVYSLQGTAAGQLNERWTINGSLGVSFISTDTVGASNRTSLSGNVDLCRLGARTSLCLEASRQARATGFNGAQYVTTAGATWRRRLDERSNLTLDGAYLQEGGLASLYGQQSQYLRVSATYDRQLRQRLRAFVSARYRRVFGGFTGQADDYGGQVGLSYSFGSLR